MGDLIDDLKVQIETSTQSADAKLDKFIAKMMKLHSTITGLEMSNVSNIASGINQISASIQNFNTRTKTSDFTRVATGMNKLSTVDAQGISNASRAMSTLAANLTGLDHISFDADGITRMADSVSKLGRKTMTEAAQNLEFLKTSLADFIGGMNGVGSLTFNPDGLVKLVNSVSRLGSTNATQSVKNLPQISSLLRSFIDEMNTVGSVTFNFSGLENLVSSISRLGGVKATQSVKNLKPIKDQLLKFVSGLNGIGALNFDTANLTSLVASISKLGGKAAGNAIPNIQNLGVALKDMMKTLSGAPAVSQNLINMTNALANLAGKGSRVSSASTAMFKGLGLYSTGAKSATKHSFNLASAIGKVYATYWTLFRAFGMVRKSIGIAADLTEVQNVIDQSFGAMAGMVDDFTSTSIQKFGMSELAAKKMSGVFMAMGKSLGAPQKEMADMSINLTKLAADMASFYNVEQKAVGEDLRSVFTGTVRPLRDYGLDLTQASLQQYAFSQGIQKSVRDMTQLEKVQLRYSYIMANTAHIQGDYARTSMTWSNQVRLLGQQFQQLGGIVGGTMINAFKPFLAAMNQVIAKIVSVAKAISDALGKIFGWQYQVSGGGAGMAGITGDLDDAAGAVDDLAGGAGGAADKLGDAAKNAKKLAGNLQGWDNLNVITSQNENAGGSGGSGGGAGSGAAAGNFGEWVPGETIWEKYKSSIDSLYELGKYIGDTLTSAMNNIDWEKTYQGARNFGRGLADFLNGLISPDLFGATGRTIAGALNTALHFLDFFGTTFDWKDFGKSIAAGINGFFGKFDFGLLARTVNTWAIGLLDTMATAIGRTNWKGIGEKISNMLKKINWKGILKGVGEVFWEAFNASIEATAGLFGISEKTSSIIIGGIGGIILAIKGFDVLKTVKPTIDDIVVALENLMLSVGNYGIIAGISSSIIGALVAISVNWDKKKADEFLEFQKGVGMNADGIQEAASALDQVRVSSDKIISGAQIEAEELEKLSKKYFSLADSAGLSSEKQMELKDSAQMLVEKCPELRSMIDLTTGRYTAQRDEIQKVIDKQEEYYQVMAYQEAVSKYRGALAEANVELSVAEKNYDSNMKALSELNAAMDDLESGCEDQNIWYEKNRYTLEAYGITMGSSQLIASQLAQQISFYGKELEESSELQSELKTRVDEANASYNAANEMLEVHREKYQELGDVISTVDFASIALNAANAIDGLGGVFVNGKQVVGEEAVALYNTIIEAYGTIDQDMYDLGEKGVVQFGVGGQAGVSEAVPTMTNELESKIVEWYNGQGYQVAFDGGKVIVTGIADGGKAHAPYSVDEITSSFITLGNTKEEEYSALGSGWAAFTAEGFRAEVEKQESATGTSMENFATNGIMNPFTTIMGINSPSTVFEGYGKYTVEGFNNGLENNYSSTRGIISTWVSSIGSWFKNMMGIASPSKIFEEFGGFTVAGFNAGISDNMKSSLNLMEQWSVGISGAFNIANPIVPEMGVHYSINRDIFDHIDTRSVVSLDFAQNDYKTELTAELIGALSDVFDYDKFAYALAREMEKANITATVNQNDLYDSTIKKIKSETYRLGHTPFPLK